MFREYHHIMFLYLEIMIQETRLENQPHSRRKRRNTSLLLSVYYGQQVRLNKHDYKGLNKQSLIISYSPFLSSTSSRACCDIILLSCIERSALSNLT